MERTSTSCRCLGSTVDLDDKEPCRDGLGGSGRTGPLAVSRGNPLRFGRQDIESAFKRSAPEITQIIDTTDHAAGKNPYYQPSKK